jgi:hypothetical protein
MIRVAFFQRLVCIGHNIAFVFYTKPFPFAGEGGPHIGRRCFGRFSGNNPAAVHFITLFDAKFFADAGRERILGVREVVRGGVWGTAGQPLCPLT